MGRRDSPDGRRRRSSYSSSHDPRTPIHRDGSRASRTSQELRSSAGVRYQNMPPPQTSYKLYSNSSATPRRRHTAPIYEHEYDPPERSRRRPSQREVSPSYDAYQRRQHHRPRSPHSSDGRSPRYQSVSEDSETTSDPESSSENDTEPVLRRGGRPLRHHDEGSEAEDDDVGPDEPAIPYAGPSRMMTASPEAASPQRRQMKAIEAPPRSSPARERTRALEEATHSRSPKSSRRHHDRNNAIVVQEQGLRRNQSRSGSLRSSRQASSILSSIVSVSTGHRTSPRKSRTKDSGKEKRPVKIVQCVICMEEFPSKKAPKLRCEHRMCHDCLKDVFNMSVTDPQHMPPKCCGEDRISLKHVEHLFGTSFKKKWNRKFEEFSARDRLYCPSRKCGEWIKPKQIRQEGDRRSARCAHCGTKVCVLCNGKWHKSLDCPNDEETQRFLKQAKEEGWQRCYSCKAMIERERGCNHMKCRCGAEFCMICGNKWKGCDCEWFNFVENDDLNAYYAERANPFGFYEGQDSSSGYERETPVRRGGVRVRPYHEDTRRQRQLQQEEDEALARQMQIDLALADTDPSDDDGGEVYNVNAMERNGGGSVSGLGISSLSGGDYYRYGNGQHRTRVRLSESPTAYDKRQRYRTPPRDDPRSRNYEENTGRKRDPRDESLERRLADRFSERRSNPPPPPEMAMGFHTPVMSPIMGGMPPAPPPPPVGPYTTPRMPPVMASMGTPPMGPAPFQHQPFGILPPHGPTLVHQPHSMPLMEYSPVPEANRKAKRRGSEGSAHKSSSMAGLNGPGVGLSRVDEWRAYVEPGNPGPEGERTSVEKLSRVR